MKTFLKACILGLIALGAMSGTANADEWRHDRHDHRGWDRYHRVNHVWYHHHYGFWRGNIFIYEPAPVYYAPVAYYAPAPAPVVQAPPVAYAGNSGYCREYESTTNIGGRPQASYGTACQQPDGSWQIMN